jgi:hypothetical protein
MREIPKEKIEKESKSSMYLLVEASIPDRDKDKF